MCESVVSAIHNVYSFHGIPDVLPVCGNHKLFAGFVNGFVCVKTKNVYKS